ncbi:hypothetical protein U4960_04315 [Altererythrobacter sp. H2]|uniref:hypothetical protein n=1 Tax=Altererythrobacter sp. H2 TaxID=3108391 RepID=UPI002B4BFF7D|nr:hypothetical protein [Altererythrobacter sp. H2]WRK96555.1 hypothetical protein U4960_04315 [Altererythrobacter sp. H2]
MDEDLISRDAASAIEVLREAWPNARDIFVPAPAHGTGPEVIELLGDLQLGGLLMFEQIDRTREGHFVVRAAALTLKGQRTLRKNVCDS